MMFSFLLQFDLSRMHTAHRVPSRLCLCSLKWALYACLFLSHRNIEMKDPSGSLLMSNLLQEVSPFKLLKSKSLFIIFPGTCLSSWSAGDTVVECLCPEKSRLAYSDLFSLTCCDQSSFSKELQLLLSTVVVSPQEMSSNQLPETP